jgi:hypothetical protein
VAGRVAGVCVNIQMLLPRMQRKGDGSPPASAEFDPISTVQYTFRARCLDIGTISKAEGQRLLILNFSYAGCTEGSGDHVSVVFRNLPTRILGQCLETGYCRFLPDPSLRISSSMTLYTL